MHTMKWTSPPNRVTKRTVGFSSILILFLFLLAGSPGAAGADFDSLMAQAKASIEHEQYSDAIRIYSEALQVLPDQPVKKIAAYSKRGEAYLHINEFKKAIDDYSEALRALPPSKTFDDIRAEFYFNEGLAFDRLGDLPAATENYTKCIDSYPQYVKAYNNRAVSNYKLNNFAAAIADVDSYLRFDTKWAGAYFIRGLSKVALKDRSGVVDLKIAAGMGHKLAQEALAKANIDWK